MSTRSVIRAGTGALALCLAAGGMLAAPAPAQAAVLGTTQVLAEVNFDDDPDGGVTCTQTGPGDVTAPMTTFAADGVPVTRTATSSAVITDNANMSDATTMSGSISHTVTATQANGQLSKVNFASTATTSLSTAIANTKCGAAVGLQGGTQFQFDLVAPTLVTVTAEAHRMVGIVQAGNLIGPSGTDIQAVVAYALGDHGTSTGTILLQPGASFIGIHQVQKQMVAPATAGSQSSSGDVTVDIAFETPGAASSTQSGSGGKYVTLGSGRSCATGSLPMTWTKKAGKGKQRVVNKAIVRVNGAKVATIKKPKKGQVSTVTGLNPEKAAEVEVTLRVKGKGKSAVERSYLRCT
jgi:hypothetical protein